MGENLKKATEAQEELTQKTKEFFDRIYAIKTDFLDWKNTFGKDTVTVAQYNLLRAKEDLNKAMLELGVNSVNTTNYLSLFNTAISKNLTDTQIDSWEKLGENLKKATEAQATYLQELKSKDLELLEAQLSSIETIKNSIKSMQESVQSSFDSVHIDTINETKNNLDMLISTSQWDKVGSAYSDYSNNLLENSNSKTEAIVELAKANQKIQKIDNKESEVAKLTKSIEDLKAEIEGLKKGQIDLNYIAEASLIQQIRLADNSDAERYKVSA